MARRRNGIRVDRHNIDSPKPEAHDTGRYVTAFTDGSYCPHTHAWGVGVWLRYSTEPPKEFTFGGTGASSAQEVEQAGLTFIVGVLSDLYDLSDKRVVLQCDCIDAFQDSYRFDLLAKGAESVKFKHVKAHTRGTTKRTWVNDRCDMLAKAEMKKYRPN